MINQKGSVINYATGLPNSSRRNRVQKMLKTSKVNKSRVEQTMMNRILASSLFSNTKPLPVGSLKKTPMGGTRTRKAPTNYQLRALNELSHRSLSMARSNIKTLKNRKNKKILTQAMNQRSSSPASRI